MMTVGIKRKDGFEKYLEYKIHRAYLQHMIIVKLEIPNNQLHI